MVDLVDDAPLTRSLPTCSSPPPCPGARGSHRRGSFPDLFASPQPQPATLTTTTLTSSFDSRPPPWPSSATPYSPPRKCSRATMPPRFPGSRRPPLPHPAPSPYMVICPYASYNHRDDRLYPGGRGT
ncbi:hypothetical protein ZWY2020_054694 [Hordeum vulgare]|nr:hypothetical protein ZWY2020_054694 [Hordeum vulgare]